VHLETVLAEWYLRVRWSGVVHPGAFPDTTRALYASRVTWLSPVARLGNGGERAMVQGVDTYAGSSTTRTQPDEMQVAPTLVPVFADESPPVADVLVAIPAYNEERFIGSVVHGVRMEGFDCVVVDDGSTDRTAEIATAAGAVVHTLPENRGKSEAVALAIKTALRMEVETLVLMDGDWQHDPREIHGLLVPIRAGVAEIVSGSRFLNGLQRSVPRVRGVGLWAMTAMTNAAVGARITDSQTGFRAFSRRAFETLSFSSDGFSVEVEVQFMAQARGLTHVEVPITARYDDPPKRNVLGQAARVTDGLIRLVAHYRPLLFFGLPSIVLLLAGLALGGLVIRTYQQSGELAGGLALLVTLLIILGSIGMFAGLLLHVLRGIFLRLEQQLQVMTRAIEGRHDRR
jgi:glycosyltransferase involved in cell wall biosynthesis